MNILTWQQAIEKIGIGNISLSQKDLSSLIIYARKFGIGKEYTFQKTEYGDEDFHKLKIVVEWWNYLNASTASEWRDKLTFKNVIKAVVNSLVLKETLVIYAVFCPSYKKGVGEYGYTGATGEHTKFVIKDLSKFVDDSKKLGLKIKLNVYFSDLLLENFEILKGSNYKIDLDKNYNDFKKYFEEFANDSREIRLLSDIDQFRAGIGEDGVTFGVINISPDKYNRVFERNLVFYKEILGWSDVDVKRRTEVLARSYEYMGRKFKEMHPCGIMYWTESAYERGILYSGFDENDPLPIIYPKK